MLTQLNEHPPCSFRDQKIICNIMQNLSSEKCTQSLFDILCEHTSKIRLDEVNESRIRGMMIHSAQEGNSSIFRIQQIVEYCTGEFYLILNTLPIELHTRNNISRLCDLTEYQLICFRLEIKSDSRYTQDDIDKIFDSSISEKEKMTAFCMGARPR